jgi:hypothetical protein
MMGRKQGSKNLDALEGKTFNFWTVVNRIGGTRALWLCRCVCGKESKLGGHEVSAGPTKSCGCKQPNQPNHFEGQTFGDWTVIKRERKKDTWKCQCICGKIKNVLGGNLRKGLSKSCGCSWSRNGGETNARRVAAKKEHGENYTPRNDPWYGQASGVHARCKDGKYEFGFSSRHELAAYLKQIAPSVCPVFGTPFVRGGWRGDSKWFGPSVDRKDNSKGYVRGNLQIISLYANAMKRDATPDQLRTFAEWVLRETPEPHRMADAGWSAGLLQ